MRIPKKYFWQGTNEKGELVRGEQRAFSAKFLNEELLAQGIKIQFVRSDKKNHQRWRKKIRATDLTAMTRQIATLLAAGIPFSQALALMGCENIKSPLATVIYDLKQHIEAGNTIAESLEKHPNYFNQLYRSLVLAGECSGTLAIMFDKLATHKEKSLILLSKIKKALFYPCAVLLVAVLVLTGLLVFVVPQFQTLYGNFGVDLPVPTKIVIMLANFLLRDGFYLIIFFGLFLALGYFSFSKLEPLARFIDKILLKIPIIGNILQNIATARFAGTLAITVFAGLPIVTALQTISEVTGNHWCAAKISTIRTEISAGHLFSAAISRAKIFPRLLVQFVMVGEESGTLAAMLHKAAEIYERKVDNALEGFSSLLDPCIMVILGFLVGGVVIAMYLPIFKLGTVTM